MDNAIKYEDFEKVDLRSATVLEAKDHPKADRLMILKLDVGGEERQIVAGIRPHYTAEGIKGKQIVIVANLEPRTLRGETSHGMLLAVKEGDSLSLITLDKTMISGLRVG
jgi:methionine--tRNA ligase beta chain